MIWINKVAFISLKWYIILCVVDLVFLMVVLFFVVCHKIATTLEFVIWWSGFWPSNLKECWACFQSFWSNWLGLRANIFKKKCFLTLIYRNVRKYPNPSSYTNHFRLRINSISLGNYFTNKESLKKIYVWKMMKIMVWGVAFHVSSSLG